MAFNFQSMFGSLFGQGAEGSVGAAKGLTAVSGIIGSVAQIKNGLAEKRAAQARSNIMQRDAENRKQVANVLRQQGREQAQQIQIETAQLIGQQRAALAANGIVLDEGTAMDLVVETAGLGAVDAITAIANAEREAAQLINEADVEMMKARLVEQEGRNLFAGSFASAGQSLAATARTMQEIENQYRTPTESIPIPGRKPTRTT